MNVGVTHPAKHRRAPVFLRKAGVASVVALFCSLQLMGQTGAPELRQILDRLEGLERANRELTEEVRALRSQLSAANPSPALPDRQTTIQVSGPPAEAPGPDMEEQMAVQKQRIEEQAQTKVEAAQKFPIRLKGMLLLNTFLNSKQGGELQYTTVAKDRGEANGGASLRQSVFGFDYQGPEVAGGGKLRASLLMDFYGGSGSIGDQSLRIRTATMQVDWKRQGLLLGIDKPIFSPRDPASLAQVGVSPLTRAGNLWMWVPQIRYTREVSLGEETSLRAQFGLVATREVASYQGANFVADVEPSRPGMEGRFQFAHDFGSGRRLGFLRDSTSAPRMWPTRRFLPGWFRRTGCSVPGAKWSLRALITPAKTFRTWAPAAPARDLWSSPSSRSSVCTAVEAGIQLALPVTERLTFHLFRVGRTIRASCCQPRKSRKTSPMARIFSSISPQTC